MACTGLTLTQLGSDTFVRANGALGASWTTPIELPQAVTIDTNTAYGGNNAGNNAEAQWNGGTIPSDQYAEIQWEYSGVLSQHFDLTFRRDTTNNFAYWTASFTHGSTAAYVADNDGVFEDDYTLSSPLATGDKVRVVVLGTQMCIWRNTGSGYVLEHTTTLPSVLPTSGTVAGNPGFDLSALGRVNNWATGSVAFTPTQVQLTGIVSVPDGPLVNGYLKVTPLVDAVIPGIGQIGSRRECTISLDSNGAPVSAFLWPTDVMRTGGSIRPGYRVTAFTAAGQQVFDKDVTLPSGATFDVSLWVS